jgi:hypothetical protein
MPSGRRKISTHEVTVPLGELARSAGTLSRIMASPAQPALLEIAYRIRLMLNKITRHVDGESAYNAELNVLTKLHGKEDPAAGAGAFEFNPEGLRAYTKARAELDEQLQTVTVPVVYLSEVMALRLAPPLSNDEYLTLEWLMLDAPPDAAATAPAAAPVQVIDPPTKAV